MITLGKKETSFFIKIEGYILKKENGMKGLVV